MGPSSPKTPSRFERNQARQASTKLYLAMKKYASHGDDDAFSDLAACLKLVEGLPVVPSPATTTRSTPHLEKITPPRWGTAPTANRPTTTTITAPTADLSATTSRAAPRSHIEKIEAPPQTASPRLEQDPSRVPTSRRYENTLMPPPCLLASPLRPEHPDAAAFLAMMRKSEARKEWRAGMRKWASGTLGRDAKAELQARRTPESPVTSLTARVASMADQLAGPPNHHDDKVDSDHDERTLQTQSHKDLHARRDGVAELRGGMRLWESAPDATSPVAPVVKSHAGKCASGQRDFQSGEPPPPGSPVAALPRYRGTSLIRNVLGSKMASMRVVLAEWSSARPP